MLLSEYLRNRGLVFKPMEKENDQILESDDLLREASELWESRQNILTIIIQARVNAIAKNILEKAIPEEVLVLRQSLVELGAILTDLSKYSSEYKRRSIKETPPESSTEESGAL